MYGEETTYRLLPCNIGPEQPSIRYPVLHEASLPRTPNTSACSIKLRSPLGRTCLFFWQIAVWHKIHLKVCRKRFRLSVFTDDVKVQAFHELLTAPCYYRGVSFRHARPHDTFNSLPLETPPSHNLPPYHLYRKELFIDKFIPLRQPNSVERLSE